MTVIAELFQKGQLHWFDKKEEKQTKTDKAEKETSPNANVKG